MLQRIKDRRTAGEEGFTLIELLVVIIILGILAAVVVFAVGGIGSKGQNEACKIDTRTLRTAEEAYAGSTVGNGSYVASTNVPASGPFVGTPGPADLLETPLITAGFLSDNSPYHYISVVVAPTATTPGSFKIRTQDTRCGAPAHTEVTGSGPAL